MNHLADSHLPDPSGQHPVDEKVATDSKATQAQHGGRAPSTGGWLLALAALGVVFGDIGTSPLYAMRETLLHLEEQGGLSRETSIMGVLSVILWSIVLVVSVKYLCFILKADNEGEGGMFSLLALGHKKSKGFGKRAVTVPVIIILSGAAMMYGDGVITPAISVLSAAEGLPMIHPLFEGHAVWIAVAILIGLFWMQKHGTTKIGIVFGPTILIWFLLLGGLGVYRMGSHLEVLKAINPVYAFQLLGQSPGLTALVLGTSVLAITGAEALYADLGHFGRKAISRAWLWVAMPCLILNYFGQAAMALKSPEMDLHYIFTGMAPEGGLRIFLVVWSLFATVIASQALITGTFSLTSQAIQLGYFPRLSIKHTSENVEGQIYMPLVNWMLAIGSIAMVLGFQKSGALASAYGVAVTLTMLISTFAYFFVMRAWKWSWWKVVLFCGVFGLIDAVYFSANLLKFLSGGWLPIVIGMFMMTIMLAWKRGRSYIARKMALQMIDPEILIRDIQSQHIVRVPGEAVFLSANPQGVPIVLLHHLKWNRCLHQKVLLISLVTTHGPMVSAEDRFVIEDLGQGLWRVICYQGYMERLALSWVVENIPADRIQLNPSRIVYYFNRENIVTGGDAPMMRWEKELYRFLSQNARPARDFYQAPPNQIVEIGLPVVL